LKKSITVVVTLFLVFSTSFAGVIASADSDQGLPRISLSCIPQCDSAFLSWERCPETTSYRISRNGKQIAFLSYEVDRYHDFFSLGNDTDTVIYSVEALDSSDSPIALSYTSVMTNKCTDDESCKTHLEYTVGNYMYRVNGVMEGPMEVAPEVTNGRTFLVIRYVTEPIGATIGWDGAEKKVTIETKSGKKIELWVGKPTAKIDGLDVQIDPDNSGVVPYVKNGRTLLPLRFSAENLGADGEDGVVWHSQEKRIELNVFDESCREIPYRWLLDVNSYDAETETLVCQNDFGVEFELSTDKIDLSSFKAGERVSVSGNIVEYTFGSNPTVACGNIDRLAVSVDSQNWFYGAVESVVCEGKKNKLFLIDALGERHEFETDLPLVCSLSLGAWIKLDLDGENVLDWRYVIDEIVEDASEEFGPIMLKVVSIDPTERIVGFNDFDDYVKNGSGAKRKAYRYQNQSILSSVETKRCYLVSGLVNQSGFKYITAVEEIPCPPMFDIELVHAPETAISGVQGIISIKVTNHNDFERRYESIFVDADTDGLFRPKQSSFKVESGSYFVAKFNFISSFEFEGLATYTVGVSCDGVEKTLDVSIMFEKPRIHLIPGNTEIRVKIGELGRYVYKVRNESESRIKIKSHMDAPEFPGTVKVEPEIAGISSGETETFIVTIFLDETAEYNQKYGINYGIKVNEAVISEPLVIVADRGDGPLITITGHTVESNKMVSINANVIWRGYEPKDIVVNWDVWGRDTTKKYDVDCFPIEFEFPCSGEFIVEIEAVTVSGESSTDSILIDIPGPRPSVQIIQEVESTGNYNEYLLYGSVNWNGLPEGKVKIEWDDGSVCEGFPCRVRFKKKDFLHLGVLTAKARSGEKCFKMILLFTFN